MIYYPVDEQHVICAIRVIAKHKLQANEILNEGYEKKLILNMLT